MYGIRSIGRLLSFITLFSIVLAFNLAQAKSIDACQNNTTFNIGAGIEDITGPAAEEGMMGYGSIGQQTAGLYQRLWARAFVIESPCNGKRVAIVNTDLGMVFQGIKQQVVKKLQKAYGLIYSDENVLLTATHEHSGPGGFSTYAFYNLTTLGFSRKNFDTIIDGIVGAIARAQQNMQPGQIKYASGNLTGISFNRSPESYLLNPESERNQYPADVDTQMTLVRFDSLAKKPIGMINWFPLHGVSMNNKNHLINGDNKGYAEYLFEQDYHADYGPSSFVAAFAQANAGDVSPNEYGHEGGSSLEGLSSVEKAGRPQYEMAKQLFNQADRLVTGGVDYRHHYVAMDNVAVDPQYTDGKPQSTCTAAIGVSMLAGTQDGEGVGKQGVTCDTISSIIPHFVCEMSRTPCQGVKPIALSTGSMKPYPWTPNILPFQVVQVGHLYLAAAPFELTTMTGRRLRKTLAYTLQTQEDKIMLAALSNAYSGYVATNEEYQLQRYEGASTHFGPWTAAALQQTFAKVADALKRGRAIETGPIPKDLSEFQISLQPGVLFDAAPLGQSFGDVYRNAHVVYRPGETVEVLFWGAHPKNDYRINGTFLTVERQVKGRWETIRRDWDWDTEYHWQRSGLASSLIAIVWRIPKETPKGLYRIVHYGNAKSFWSGKIFSYTGNSSTFEVI